MEIITDDLIGKSLIIFEEWYCDAIYCFGVYKDNDIFRARRKVRVNNNSGTVHSDENDARIFPLSFKDFEGKLDIYQEEEKKIVTKFKVVTAT